MTYLEQIDTAEANNIDAGDLYLAQIVAWNFGKDHPDFERVCSAVKTLWLDTDKAAQDDIAYALKDLLENEEVSLDGVMRKGTEDYKKVRDYAIDLHFN